MPHITVAFVSNADAAKEPTLLAQQGKAGTLAFATNSPQPATDDSGKPNRKMGPPEDTPPPAPPPPSALKADWVAHVAATTELSEEEAAQLTKAQLQDIANGGELPSAGINSSASERKQDKSGSSVQGTESSSPSPAPTAENLSRQDLPASQAQSSTAHSTSGSTQETGTSPQPQSSSSGETPQGQASSLQAPPSARDLIHLARRAYEARDWDSARAYLEQARLAEDADEDELATALAAVQAASEETPSAGGFLTE